MSEHEIIITPFEAAYQKKIEDLVLTVQNEEFNLGITAQDQPDLPNLKAFYQDRGGEFWIAVDATQDDVLGCIGFEYLEVGAAALRKMFLKKDVRGNKTLKLAQKMYDTFLALASRKEIKVICLDTPLVAHAAHRFYERNGWKLAPIEELPASYKLPKIDPKLIKFYLLRL